MNLLDRIEADIFHTRGDCVQLNGNSAARGVLSIVRIVWRYAGFI